MKASLLVIWHSRTGASEALAQAVAEGTGPGVDLIRARDVKPDHLRMAAGYVFVCPENLASISGEMKEMFDRCYYPALGQLEGRPYATAIAAGSDGQGAQRQIDRIATGWKLRRVAEPIIVITHAQKPEDILAPKKLRPVDLSSCRELGEAFANGLDLGIF